MRLVHTEYLMTGNENTPYCTLDVSERRFTIKRFGVLLGHVIDNGDGTWSIELGGKVIEVLYGSLRCAADAILALNPPQN